MVNWSLLVVCLIDERRSISRSYILARDKEKRGSGDATMIRMICDAKDWKEIDTHLPDIISGDGSRWVDEVENTLATATPLRSTKDPLKRPAPCLWLNNASPLPLSTSPAYGVRLRPKMVIVAVASGSHPSSLGHSAAHRRLEHTYITVYYQPNAF